MSNIYQFDQDPDAAERRAVEASEWIAKLDKGLSIADKEQLTVWMRANPRNEAELLEMAQMWDKMDALARLSEVFPHEAERESKPVFGSSRPFGIAASFAFVVAGLLIAGFLLNLDNDAVPGLTSPEIASYETAVGGISTIELSDGSLITLNTDSRAIISFSKHQRLVRLERGEMHIDVAHDANRPLSVVAAGRVVKAIGTKFSVRIDDSQRVEVVVEDGRVQVGVHEQGKAPPTQAQPQREAAALPLLLAQGERAILDDNNEILQELEPEEIEVHLSWQNGNLIFRGESLATAVAEVGRYTPVEFVIEDETLQKIRVAGLFKAGDVAGFLSSLQANFDIVYQRSDDDTISLHAAQARSTDAPQ